jgi:hypothetical protein
VVKGFKNLLSSRVLLCTIECSFCSHKCIHLLNDKGNETGLGDQRFLSILQLPTRPCPLMWHLWMPVPFSGTTVIVAFGFRGCSFLNTQWALKTGHPSRIAVREFHNWISSWDWDRKQNFDNLRFTSWKDRSSRCGCAMVHYAVIK